MRLSRAAGIGAIAVCLAVTVSAQPPSFSRTDYRSAPGPRGVVAGDFNRDGAIDLALANNGEKSVTILTNQTGSGRGFVVAQRISLGGGPFDIVADDLNNDSVTDLVVPNADLNSIDILLGEPDGTFQPPVQRPVAGNPRGVAIAQMNQDSHLDIVFTQFASNSVQILYGDGSGWNFVDRPGTIATGIAPQGVLAHDFNGDGRRDIAVANTGASPLSVLYQNADGTFRHVAVSGPRYLNVLTMGDFNRDGWPDIAAASTSSNFVVLYKGSQTAFTQYDNMLAGASPRGIAAADLNRDGRLDLVTANRADSSVSVFLARTSNPGLFNDAFSLAAGTGSRDVALADFNFDDQIDIATANEYAGTATVLLNAPRPQTGPFWRAFTLPPALSGAYSIAATADFNKNGRIDVVHNGGVTLDGETVVELPTSGTGSRIFQDAVTGDFNKDGNPDVVILTYHISASTWGADLFHGDGTGGFRYGGTFGSLPGFSFAMRAADVSLDGRLDLLVADNEYPSSKIHVLLGAAGGFGADHAFELPQVTDFDVADVNRDGKPDLAASHSAGVTVALGDGTGSFSTSQFLGTNRARNMVALDDVNRDGSIDVVAGGVAFITVWLGSPSGTFPAAPLTSGSPGSSNGPLHLADFNGDGRLDAVAPGAGLYLGVGDGTFGEPLRINIGWEDSEAVDYDRDGRMDLVISTSYYSMVLLNKAQRGENLPPVVLVRPVTVEYGNQYEVEGTYASDAGSFDPNLDDLVYEWTDSEGRIIGDWAVFSWGSPLPPGTYPFTLTLRDGHGGTASDALQVTISPMKESVAHLAWSSAAGAWRQVDDPTAAQALALWHPNAGAPKVNTASANPTNYVDVSILADPTQTYKLWVRLRAENNYWGNDSIFVQFEGGAVTQDGHTRFATGTTDALDINLEQCPGCGVSGWGWRDERWGDRLAAAPVLLRFPSGGWHRVRIQTREDGVLVDQITLSSERYLSRPPGPAKNDRTILNMHPSPD
jgi:hypothetical protein